MKSKNIKDVCFYNYYEKMERDSNQHSLDVTQHSLDVTMFIFLQYISPYEKGIFRQ